MNTIPMDLAPAESEEITVADTAIGLTTSLYSAPNVIGVFLTLETAQVRFYFCGKTPTSSSGHLYDVGQPLLFKNREALKNLKFIRTGSVSGKITATTLTN